MFIIIEVLKEKDKTRYISPMNEEGFLLDFSTEEQAIDYIEDLKEEHEEMDYQIVEVV